MAAPSLDFDWEQGLYRAARWVFRAFNAAPPPPPEHAAYLDPHQQRLTVLARVFAGETARVVPADGVGGVRGDDILVPPLLAIAPSVAENEDVYRLRVALGAMLIERGAPSTGFMAYLRQVTELFDDIADDFPGLVELNERACVAELASRPDLNSLQGSARLQEKAIQQALSGGEPWLDDTLKDVFHSALQVPDILIWGRPVQLRIGGKKEQESSDNAPTPASDSSEAEMAVSDDLNILNLKEEDVKELPVHVFEKVETLDNWSGGVRPMDGSDELDDQLEALEEVDLRDLVRGGEQAQSVLKADLSLDIEIPDVQFILPDEKGIPFPEWDYRKGDYRPDWTTVYPTAIPVGTDDWAQREELNWHSEIEQLRRELSHLKDTLRPRRRQLDGEDIDLDAIIDEHAAIAAGHGGNPRLYQRLHRQEWDLATTVLLDLSLSADGWVNGRRVLDVARAALLVMGEVLADSTSLRIIAFASHTRNQIRTWDILNWDEPWSKARGRMGELRPQGFTRIGPAVRYATDDLKHRSARHKLMIVLTDGKPTDFDKYEGRYGVADVRRAVTDAREMGTRVHAFAIDNQATPLLATMFGRGHWNLLPQAELLPRALISLTERMAKN